MLIIIIFVALLAIYLERKLIKPSVILDMNGVGKTSHLLIYRLHIHIFLFPDTIVDVYKNFESNVLYVLSTHQQTIRRIQNTLVEFETQSIDTEPDSEFKYIMHVYIEDWHSYADDEGMIEFRKCIPKWEQYNTIKRNIKSIQELLPGYKLLGKELQQYHKFM